MYVATVQLTVSCHLGPNVNKSFIKLRLSELLFQCLFLIKYLNLSKFLRLPKIVQIMLTLPTS